MREIIERFSFGHPVGRVTRVTPQRAAFHYLWVTCEYNHLDPTPASWLFLRGSGRRRWLGPPARPLGWTLTPPPSTPVTRSALSWT